MGFPSLSSFCIIVQHTNREVFSIAPLFVTLVRYDRLHDMDAREVVQMPNFAVAAGSLQTLADQVSRCANLPAVNGGVQLHAVL